MKKIALAWHDVNPPFVYVGRSILGERSNVYAGWAVHEDDGFPHHNSEFPYYAEFHINDDEPWDSCYGNFISLEEAKIWVDNKLIERGWILIDQSKFQIMT